MYWPDAHKQLTSVHTALAHHDIRMFNKFFIFCGYYNFHVSLFIIHAICTIAIYMLKIFDSFQLETVSSQFIYPSPILYQAFIHGDFIHKEYILYSLILFINNRNLTKHNLDHNMLWEMAVYVIVYSWCSDTYTFTTRSFTLSTNIFSIVRWMLHAELSIKKVWMMAWMVMTRQQKEMTVFLQKK